MSTTAVPDRFTTLPDEHALQATVTELEEHGFSVEVVGDLDAARQAVLARVPEGSPVMTNASVTLAKAWIADAINDGGGRWGVGAEQDVRARLRDPSAGNEGDRRPARLRPGQRARVTRDGTLVIASASGSQLASYAWGAANVIFVVGVQKLVPTLAAAHERIYQHSLPLEDARAQVAYGQHSQVGKILEIHQELPGRIHIVLIRQQVGF